MQSQANAAASALSERFRPALIAFFQRRIRNAAETVCSSLDSRVIGLREQHQHCVTTAVRRGVEAVGNDNLTQYHLYGSKAVAAAKPRAAK